MNSSNADKFKKEDKKAFKLFALFIFLGALVGGIFGALSSSINTNISHMLASKIMSFLSIITPFANLFLSIFVIIVTQILYKNSRSKYEIWKKECEVNEDEEGIERIENKLSYIMLLSTINTIFAFFFFGAGAIFFQDEMYHDSFCIVKDLSMFVGFLLSIAYTIVIQKKVVNFEKEINPILKGSIYDVKFAKKWLDSCDEALKLNIYKSAYKAYTAVNVTCVTLWLCCIIISTFWDIGIMPMVVVTIIWLVQTISYHIESIRLSKFIQSNNDMNQ